jgi:[ribosomal protein S18]-alanine N-acetyltransferase
LNTRDHSFSVEIRDGQLSDAIQLYQLELKCFSGDLISLRSFKRFLSNSSPALVWIVESENEMIGYIMIGCRKNSFVYRIYSIAVHPEFSGRGIGRSLIKYAEDYLTKRNAQEIRLEIREDNHSSRQLFSRSGYQSFGVYHRYYEDGQLALRYHKTFFVSGKEPVT